MPCPGTLARRPGAFWFVRITLHAELRLRKGQVVRVLVVHEQDPLTDDKILSRMARSCHGPSQVSRRRDTEMSRRHDISRRAGTDKISPRGLAWMARFERPPDVGSVSGPRRIALAMELIVVLVLLIALLDRLPPPTRRDQSRSPPIPDAAHRLPHRLRDGQPPAQPSSTVAPTRTRYQRRAAPSRRFVQARRC